MCLTISLNLYRCKILRHGLLSWHHIKNRALICEVVEIALIVSELHIECIVITLNSYGNNTISECVRCSRLPYKHLASINEECLSLACVVSSLKNSLALSTLKYDANLDILCIISECQCEIVVRKFNLITWDTRSTCQLNIQYVLWLWLLVLLSSLLNSNLE